MDEISLTNSSAEMNPSDQLFGFGFINIRSLNKNFPHLEIDQVMLQKDIVFVTETWKDPSSHKTYELNCLFVYAEPQKL